jgi:hypothetical protein
VTVAAVSVKTTLPPLASTETVMSLRSSPEPEKDATSPRSLIGWVDAVAPNAAVGATRHAAMIAATAAHQSPLGTSSPTQAAPLTGGQAV